MSGVHGGALGTPITGDISDCFSDKYTNLRMQLGWAPLLIGLLLGPCMDVKTVGDVVVDLVLCRE